MQLKPRFAGLRLCKTGVGVQTLAVVVNGVISMQSRWMFGVRLVFLLVLVGSVSACSSLTQRDRNTITGASIGAVAGAVLTGGSTAGTVGGAAVGGVIGHQVGGSKKK